MLFLHRNGERFSSGAAHGIYSGRGALDQAHFQHACCIELAKIAVFRFQILAVLSGPIGWNDEIERFRGSIGGYISPPFRASHAKGIGGVTDLARQCYRRFAAPDEFYPFILFGGVMNFFKLPHDPTVEGVVSKPIGHIREPWHKRGVKPHGRGLKAERIAPR